MQEMYNINRETETKTQTYFEYYKCKEESELFKIAKEKNVNPTLLAALNGMEPLDYVYENQLLMIPKKDYVYYITKDGDTIETVSHTFDTTPDNLLKNNQTIYLHSGQLLVNKIK